jgi:hypothetical protein
MKGANQLPANNPFLAIIAKNFLRREYSPLHVSSSQRDQPSDIFLQFLWSSAAFNQH